MDKRVENIKQIEKLKEIRQAEDLNQRQIAGCLGIPLRTWEDWESGRRKMPEYLLRLVVYYVKINHQSLSCDKKCDDVGKPVSDKSVHIINDCDGKRVVIINDPRFKGRRSVNWNTVEDCLKEYIGKCAEIVETGDMIYLGKDFPDEFAHSKDTKTLKGANLYAKANTVTAINELIQIATNKTFSENYDEKHRDNAKFGWYRYDTRFALPKYSSDGELVGYNIFGARMVVRHAKDGKLYLYDILRTKKETSKPLEQ